MTIKYISLFAFTLALTACTADGEPAQAYDEVKVSDVSSEPAEDANEQFIETTPWSEVTAGSTTDNVDRYDNIDTDTLEYDYSSSKDGFTVPKKVNPTGDGYQVKPAPIGSDKGYKGIYEDEDVPKRKDIKDIRYKE